MIALESSKPGKLGNPDLTLGTDPRVDPRIAGALMIAGGLAPGVQPPEVGADYDACLAYCSAFEMASAEGHDQLWARMPECPGVATSADVISGVEGNDITLHIHRPAKQDEPLPCVVHFHGGGMVLMSAEDPGFVRWRNSLAEAGMVVIGVEFRNGGGRLGPHPFPAGLNDCARAVQWTYSNRERLNVSSIVACGESGGGNLAIATALKANAEGWAHQIDGVYAMCPYISGQYAEPPSSLPSLRENDGYLLDGPMMSALVRVYDPGGRYSANPLAWPMQARVEDLRGLPPHVISVNELDPLRDEGLAFYRKLLAAEVSAFGRTVHGTPHAGDRMFPDVVPEVFADTVASICSFARNLKS